MWKFLVSFEGGNFESFRQLGSRRGNSPDFDDRPALISEARRISSNVSQRNTPFPRFILFDLLSPAGVRNDNWRSWKLSDVVDAYVVVSGLCRFQRSFPSSLPNDIPNHPWQYHAMYDIYFIILYGNIIFPFFFINNYLHILFAFVPFDSINLSGWAITFNKFYEFLKRRCSWLHYKIQRDCFNRDACRKK